MVFFPSNSILDKLPAHLRQYIVPQNYEDYTPINQAVWRYVMRKNVTFLRTVAHHTYLEGLRMTGVSIEEIPDMYGMNRILKEIGWAAAAVDGFIPPSAFMEFQAYNVLVVAVDIRTLEHIEYTPAPDIIHEAAGHAPIIANPEYSEYLRRLGEIGSKAISSSHDWDVYEAVRLLSQLKELELPDQLKIDEAQAKVDLLQSKNVKASEMSKIRNLQWWTVEYGLIGSAKEFKIYGAGLLSSIGESEWCLREEVEKLPYTIDAATTEFDITRPQPKLFITPSFAHLSKVLEQFANSMALRKGGVEGLLMLVESMRLGTIELSTGLQVSGVFTFYADHEGMVSMFKTTGETALAYRNKELVGHSKDRYTEGFISPLGKLRGINLAIEDMSPRDLEAYGIYEGQHIELEYEGNVKVNGTVITGTRNLQGKIMLITLENGAVTKSDKLIYSFPDSIFHMAIGKSIVSAYAGPADNLSFSLIDHNLSPSARPESGTAELIAKKKAYEDVRVMRSNARLDDDLLMTHLEEFKVEWLLTLEIYEIFIKNNRVEGAALAHKNLMHLRALKPQLKNLITSGIEIAANEVEI